MSRTALISSLVEKTGVAPVKLTSVTPIYGGVEIEDEAAAMAAFLAAASAGAAQVPMEAYHAFMGDLAHLPPKWRFREAHKRGKAEGERQDRESEERAGDLPCYSPPCLQFVQEGHWLSCADTRVRLTSPRPGVWRVTAFDAGGAPHERRIAAARWGARSELERR